MTRATWLALSVVPLSDGVLCPPLPAAGDRAHYDPGPDPEDDQIEDHLPGDQQPSRLGLGGDIAEADGGEHGDGEVQRVGVGQVIGWRKLPAAMAAVTT